MPTPVLDVILRTVGRVLGRVIPDADQLEEARAELERMAIEGELQVEQLAVERLRIRAEDRADARGREKVIQDRVPGLLALLALILLTTLIVGLFFLTPPEQNAPILHNLVGLIEGIVLTVFTYYFGSSAGSRRKQDTIDRAVDRQGTEFSRPGPEPQHLDPLPPDGHADPGRIGW